jgi:hypothetical protein
MTYANGRVIHDADSHTMETADWLAPYLEGEHLEKLGSLYSKRDAGVAIVKQIDLAKARKTNPEAAAEAAANPIAGPKGWLGYGAFDTDERTKALDWLGFGSQLVFPTFGLGAITKATDEETMYVAAQALNRAQCAFCAADPRLVAVAFVPLDNPLRALAELDAALEMGAGAIMISAAPAGDRSPGHPDLDPFWRKLSETNIPFMLHIGPGTRTQPKPFHNNGRERAPDLHGGGENLRFADYMCLWYAPQEFLTAMIYDGVFQRFPDLRGGVIESGAGWVPDFLRQLDLSYASFKRTDPYLQQTGPQAVGISPSRGEVHAIPQRGCRPDDPRRGAGTVHVLQRLSAPGRHQGSAGQVPEDPGRHRGARARRLLPPQLRGDDGHARQRRRGCRRRIGPGRSAGWRRLRLPRPARRANLRLCATAPPRPRPPARPSTIWFGQDRWPGRRPRSGSAPTAWPSCATA